MPGDWKAEEHILKPGPCPDVVDDQRARVLVIPVLGDDGDMGQVSGEHHGDDVARLIIRRVITCWQGGTVSFEIGPQVGYAAVVDVGVGLCQAPLPGIRGKIRPHVIVYAFLQIDA